VRRVNSPCESDAEYGIRLATMMTPKRISIVIPCYNEEDAFPHLRAAVTDLVTRIQAIDDIEVILVNDGSKDQTWKLIQLFRHDHVWVRGIDLSRNFGHQAALTCGYEHATGDAIVCLDADLQDPPSVIEEMIAQWKLGFDVVYAVRRKRAGESTFKLVTAAAFYRGLKLLGAPYLRADCGDFRLMSRASLNAFLRMPEKHRFIRGMVGWLGFKTTDVVYDRAARIAGETKYPFRKMFKLASDAVISSSTIPLRFPYYFAVAVAVVAMIACGSWAISNWWAGLPVFAGGLGLTALISFIGALNLIALGVLGEYVGRIYEQAKDRPIYLVRETIGDRSAEAQRPLRTAA
jgi:polyisoprenyl-phosphate glycosyltransferase